MNGEWKLLIRRLVLHPIDTFIRVKRYVNALVQYKKNNTRESLKPKIAALWPCLFDWSSEAGHLSYYFWQDLWAARKIFSNKPSSHFDVGSRIDGFIAHILPFVPVTLIDIRPLPYKIDNLSFVCGNATDMSAIKDSSIDSLSSLCAVEHFGLGRYGDPIDPEASFKAMKELQRILAIHGRLYVAVPIGSESIYFNAHRVFAVSTILSTFDLLCLKDFAVIDTRSSKEPSYMEHADISAFDAEINHNGALVGLFEFIKPDPNEK